MLILKYFRLSFGSSCTASNTTRSQIINSFHRYQYIYRYQYYSKQHCQKCIYLYRYIQMRTLKCQVSENTANSIMLRNLSCNMARFLITPHICPSLVQIRASYVANGNDARKALSQVRLITFCR